MLSHLGSELFTLFKDIVPISHPHSKPKQGGIRCKQANPAHELEKLIDVTLEASRGSDPRYTRNVFSATQVFLHRIYSYIHKKQNPRSCTRTGTIKM